jgi:hypothetical protein
MMQAPETYRLELENQSLEQLRKERDRLIRSIRDYEKRESETMDAIVCPSPSVVYYCNNLYLIETIKLIIEKNAT